MTDSLRALLAGIVDYAGLFPPAKLPLEQAIRNYARYRSEPESWMLGRFICPAARLAELGPVMDELFREGPPLAISALGRGGQEGEEFVAGTRADLESIDAFRGRHADRVRVDAFEVRLPGGELYLRSCAAVLQWLIPVIDLLRSHTPPVCSSFEPNFGPVWNSQLVTLVEWLSRSRTPAAGRPFGVKLRCGGLEAGAFPSPEQVAFTLAACRDAGVPLKFTAGLHHPVRRFDAGVQAPMHGFLNLFVAGVLAQARGLSAEQLRLVLEDEDADHFDFTDQGLGWQTWQATTDEVDAARQHRVTSFGSCSFDEPRDDLRALGLLP